MQFGNLVPCINCVQFDDALQRCWGFGGLGLLQVAKSEQKQDKKVYDYDAVNIGRGRSALDDLLATIQCIL